MSNFKGPFLQILTPETIDGINVKYDANNQIKYKETHLPLSARKNMEKENQRLPPQLKHIIKQQE